MVKEFKLIDTDKASEWHDLIDGKDGVEIHHYPEYLSLYEEHLKSKCYLFYYGNGKGSIFAPFFIDKINHLPHLSEKMGGDYQDLISPWYLTGPCIHGDINDDDIKMFWNEIELYCRTHRIVSGYCRLNPFSNCYERFKDQIVLRKICNIPWAPLEPENNIESCDFTVETDRDFCHIRHFYDLYSEPFVNGPGATDYLTFPLDFISKLISRYPDNVHLISVRDQEELVGGALFVESGDIMYYYFGSEKETGENHDVWHCIMNKAKEIARDNGVRAIDLGGELDNGRILRGKEKMVGFEKDLFELKMIFNRREYERICRITLIDSVIFEEATLFPEYRYLRNVRNRL